jgi:aspartate/methionine/tyrosine aminotransferase
MKIQGVAATSAGILDACKKLGPGARFAVVLTNPDNPTGNHYPRTLLEEVYGEILKNYPRAHILSDELYCHSQLPAGARRTPFVSAFELTAYRSLDRDRVHVVWGFAKDFGLSGFKAGFVVSTNECVHAAIRDARKEGSPCPTSRSGWFSPFDSLKNFALTRVMSGDLPQRAMTTYQTRLDALHGRLASALRGARILFNENTSGGQFFWLDLREFLDLVPSPTETGIDPEILALLNPPSGDEEIADGWRKEKALLDYLAAGNGGRGVTLLPGRTLAAPEAGFFRLCFTCEEPAVMTNAVVRLIQLLQALRKP